MAKRFSTLQKEAEEMGYSLQQKGDRYYASWEGIALDDDDRERLVDDMAAVIEVSADDSPFTLNESPNEAGEAVIVFEGKEFADLSIAKALAQAKEAKLAREKPAPATKRAFSRGAKPAPVEAKPQEEDMEPWVEPAPAQPNGAVAAPAPAPTSDRKLFFEAIDELTNTMVAVRDRLAKLLEAAPQEPTPAPVPQRPRITRAR